MILFYVRALPRCLFDLACFLISFSSLIKTCIILQAGVSDVEEAILKLQNRFDSLVVDTRSELENTKVKVDDLVQKITLLPPDIRLLHKDFIKNNMEYFARKREISDIFVLLNTYWDYLNSDILEQIIKKLSLDVLERLQSFKMEQQNFINHTTVKEFCEAAHICNLQIEPPSGFIEIISTHSWDDTVYLREVDEFHRNLAVEIKHSIHEMTVLVKRIIMGSVMITVFVPKESKTIFFATNKTFFLDNNIIEFEVNHTCIYSKDVSQGRSAYYTRVCVCNVKYIYTYVHWYIVEKLQKFLYYFIRSLFLF